ncbi:MAG: PAS domain S-box protein [Candidatus Helarchaeota archaeon]
MNQTNSTLNRREKNLLKGLREGESHIFKNLEKSYQLLFDNSPIAIAFQDLQGNVIYCNTAIKAISGCSTNHIIGKNGEILLKNFPEHLKIYQDRLAKLKKGEFLKPIELPLRKDNGSIVWVKINSSLLRLGDKNIIQTVFQDITHQKLMQMKLEESEENFKAVTEQSLFGIIIIQDRKIIYSNQMVIDILEYSEEELLNWTIEDFARVIHHEDRSKALSKLEQEISGKSKSQMFASYRIISKSGHSIWIKSYVKKILFNRKTATLISFIDITKQKSAENKSKMSEEKFQDLIQNMSNGVAIYEAVDGGKDFIFKEFNRTAEKIENIAKEKLIGRRVTEVFPDVRRFGLFEVFKRVWETGVPEYHPISFYKDNGIAGWRENLVFKLSTGEIIAVYDDLTQQKRTEQELLNSKNNLTEAQRIAHIGNWNWDIVRNELSWSDEVYRIFGLKPQEISLNYETFLNYVHEEDRELVQQAVNEALFNNKPYSIDHRIVLPDGSVKIVHEQAIVTYDEDGKPIRILGTVQDITKQKLIELKLIESKEKYCLITENTNDLIAIVNKKLEVEFSNEKTHKRILGYLGYSLEDTKNKSLLEFIHPEDVKRIIEGIKKCFQIGTSRVETRIRNEKGQYIWFEVSGKSFRDIDGELKVLTVSRDISERKNLEEVNKKYFEDLKREVEIKTKELINSEKLASIGLLAAGIAHELNNPIMGIINYAEIIKEQLVKKEIDIGARPFSFINGIIEEAYRISKIVDGISKLAQDKINDYSLIDISKVIYSSIYLFNPQIKRNQIEVRVNLHKILPEVPIKINDIQKVFINILENSIEAIEEKFKLKKYEETKKISISTNFKMIDDKRFIEIQIWDNGKGIKQENLCKVFNPFFTTKLHTKRHGRGLGLSICYNIIKSYGGNIEIISEYGKYTQVIINLPIKRDLEKFKP